MSKCGHSWGEMDSACADGLCPICLEQELTVSWKANAELRRELDGAYEKAAKIVIDNACNLNRSGELFPEPRGELDVVRRSYAKAIRALKSTRHNEG